MGCCSNRTHRKQGQNSKPLDISDCLKLLAEKKDSTSFLKTLCSAAGFGTTDDEEAAKPGVECVVVPVLSLCQEINIFDLSSCILDRIIKCTFASLFSRVGPELCNQVYSQYELFFKTEPSLDFSTFCSLFTKQVYRLYGIYKSFNHPEDFYAFLISTKELEDIPTSDDQLTQTYTPITAYLAKQKYLEELVEEFTKIEFALCQDFLRMEIDLVILMTRLVELATNTQGGISGITEALNRVARGEATRYFEDDDFDDLYDAAEEVADVIVKIAKLYRERFKVFKQVGEPLICSRPQPPVKSPIREIPVIPPTVIA